MPKKIYLDQKDYSRIARGLLGESGFQADLDVYNFLLPLVNSEKITIYFSWCHLTEGLKWYTEQELLESYCHAVDNLTKGHCIIFPPELEKRELELFLAHNFHFNTSLLEDSYPYGKYKDAIYIDEKFGLGLSNDIIKKMEEGILSSKSPRKERKAKLHILKDPKKLKQHLHQITESELLPLYKSMPGSEELSKIDIIALITGSKREKIEISNKLLSGVLTFKNLITFYSIRFPQLRRIGHFFDESSKKLVDMIQATRILQSLVGKSPISESGLKADLIKKFSGRFDDDIHEFSQRYNFSPEEAKSMLIKSKLSVIPSNNAIITFVIEYYKRNKGDFNRARNPLVSDLPDLLHLINLPYVDFFLADRFFTEVVKQHSGVFKTRVLRNLNELRDCLASEFDLQN